MSDESEDVLRPIADNGDGTFVVERNRPDRTEIGIIRTGVDGLPIPPGVELINVSSHETPGLYKARTLYKMAGGAGPAQVSTPKYKAGWDAVFSKPNSDLN